MTATQLRESADSGIAAPLFLSVAGSAYVVLVGWAMGSTSFDVWGGLLVAPVLVALTVPLARRVARREEDKSMATFLIAALVLKLIASLVRYAVAFQVYDGVADAGIYHKAGTEYAHSFRLGIFEFGTDRIIGTGFMKILTGLVYAVTGPTKVGGFLIFSWIGFWGLYFFYRAFRIGLPHCDHRRYARLVFLLPSMLFWPSSIGKEAWMMFTIGLGCLGAAKLFASQRGGYALLILGGVGTTMVRPHITLILVASVVAGMIVRRSASPRSLGPLTTARGACARRRQHCRRGAGRTVLPPRNARRSVRPRSAQQDIGPDVTGRLDISQPDPRRRSRATEFDAHDCVPPVSMGSAQRSGGHRFA